MAGVDGELAYYGSPLTRVPDSQRALLEGLTRSERS